MPDRPGWLRDTAEAPSIGAVDPNSTSYIRRREIPTNDQHQPLLLLVDTGIHRPEMLLESLLATEGVAHDRFDVEPHK